jgi:hypothetical protein
MPGFKRVVIAGVVAGAIACTAIAPAEAGPRGFGHLHPWGLGRGLVGAVVGLATLPLVIASAAIAASVPDVSAQPNYAQPPQTYYAPQPQTYYAPPAPAYYAAPPAYPAYIAPRAYYYAPRAPVYYSAPRTYYAPRAYYAPRPGNYASYGGYHAGGYAYARR